MSAGAPRARPFAACGLFAACGGLLATALVIGLACAQVGVRAGTIPLDTGTAPPKSPSDPRPQFTLLYFNDLHGHLVPFAREGDTTRVGGAARMATLVARIRAENDRASRPTILVEGGDIFQGTPLSSVFKGEPDFKFLNMIGLDAMVLGNHEFDFGLDVLRRRMSEADFPILAANVLTKDGGRLLARPYALRELPNGVRVGILGLVTDDTPETTDPVNVASLTFQPPLLAAARWVPVLQDSADVLVGLTHIGSEADVRLADTYEDFDVIVGGHDQVLIHRPLVEDDVIITQAQEHGLYLGRLDLAVAGQEVELLADTIYPITRDIPDDPAVAAMVASYTKRLDRELNQRLGVLAGRLNGERHELRHSPTNFGLLLTTMMRDLTGADAAVINSGAVRASIDAGPVTLGEILQALPFTNRIVTVQLMGDAVERMLAQSLRARGQPDGGGFLQVAGIRYADADSGAVSVEIAGAPLDRAKLYTIAITDFLFSGGDGYVIFRKEGRNPRDTGKLLARALTERIRENSPLSVPDP
ncbi:MAG: 5'-nucleotidase C-terminal domain-containing protein [Gemmatimonadetes bacterium]|nr:5'-nucleotidase C-terminal domain-containing protein [Gemmatimonadota bacterium]